MFITRKEFDDLREEIEFLKSKMNRMRVLIDSIATACDLEYKQAEICHDRYETKKNK